jgi:uncharacterized integral membrane protein
MCFLRIEKIESATKAQNCLKKKTVTVDRHSVKFENVLSELILGVILINFLCENNLKVKVNFLN